MGLFDTILLDPPLACSRCGAELEIQTKHFDPMMVTYRVGSLLHASPVLSGILQETAFCDRCHRADRERTDPIFLVIWHSILAGVELSEADAESRLAAIDRLDLIEWLDQAQRAERDWRSRFRALYRDVSMWHEHLHSDPSEDDAGGDEQRSAARALAMFHRLPAEILDTDDPLAAILEHHRETSPEYDGML